MTFLSLIGLAIAIAALVTVKRVGEARAAIEEIRVKTRSGRLDGSDTRRVVRGVRHHASRAERHESSIHQSYARRWNEPAKRRPEGSRSGGRGPSQPAKRRPGRPPTNRRGGTR